MKYCKKCGQPLLTLKQRKKREAENAPGDSRLRKLDEKRAARREARREKVLTIGEWGERCKTFMDGRGWDKLAGMAGNDSHKHQFAALRLITEYAFGLPESMMKINSESTQKVLVVRVDAAVLPEVKRALGGFSGTVEDVPQVSPGDSYQDLLDSVASSQGSVDD